MDIFLSLRMELLIFYLQTFQRVSLKDEGF